MKKKNFDAGLYREGLRQLRVFGITMLAIFVLASVLVPLSDAVSLSAYPEWSPSYTVHYSSYLSQNPLILLSFPVAAPLLTLALFGFLNKRNACDLYHAIPQTRNALFFSFFAAIVTWLVILIAVPALVSEAVCLLFPKYLEIYPLSALQICTQALIASIGVAAAVLLAMSMTGTIFTNLVVALLIIFLPRVLIYVVSSSLDSALPYVASLGEPALLDSRINLITGMSLIPFGSGMTDDIWSSWRSGAYTLLLGIVYLLLARFCFARRKSETAGQAAVSRHFQTVFRMTVALVICLIPLTDIFSATVVHNWSAGRIYGIVVWYIIAVIVYFLYELISTRKWKTLLRTIPGLGLLALVNVAILLSMYGFYSSESEIQPSAEEISYVKVVPYDGSSYTYYSTPLEMNVETKNYFDEKIADVEITNPDVIRMVSKRLVDTVNYYKADDQEKYTAYQGYDSIDFTTFAIQTGRKTIYRNILLSNSDYKELGKALKQIKEVQELYQNLPEYDPVNMSSMGELDADSAGRVYETLREEIKTMEFEDWYVLVAEAGSGHRYTIGSYILMTLVWYQSGKSYEIILPISEQMPKTWTCYMEELFRAADPDADTAMTAMQNPDVNVISLEINKIIDGRWINWYASDQTIGGEPAMDEVIGEDGEISYAMNRQLQTELAEAMQKAKDRLPEPGDDYYYISWNWEENGEFNGTYRYFVFQEGELPEEIESYFDKAR